MDDESIVIRVDQENCQQKFKITGTELIKAVSNWSEQNEPSFKKKKNEDSAEMKEEKMEPQLTQLEQSSAGCNQGIIPTRFVMAALTFTGYLTSIIFRVNINVAIVAMVNNYDLLTINRTEKVEACAELWVETPHHSISLHNMVSQRHKSFSWDIETQSNILGAFYYGYVISQLPGSYLVQRFGAKWPFGLSIFTCSILTLIIPIAAKWGAACVILVRVTQGIVSGAVYSAISVLISNWIPLIERSRIYTFIYCGQPLGVLVGMIVSGVLCDSNFLGGWPSVFYVFGILGCLWFVLWTVLIYDTPLDHPRISQSELKFIQGCQKKLRTNKTDIPWVSIMKSIPVWALIVAYAGNNWGIYLLSIETPTYLSNILHIEIQMNSLLSSLPYIFQMVVGLAASHVADKLLQSGQMTISSIRKIMHTIACVLPGICFLCLVFAGCRPIISIILFCLAIISMGFSMPGCFVMLVDITPFYTGVLTGIVNTFGNMGGILVPYVVGQVTKNGQTLENWRWVFIIGAIVIFAAGITLDVFGSAEIQPWDPSASQEKSAKTNHGFVPEQDSSINVTKVPQLQRNTKVH